MGKAMLITFEGIDGAGKTLQINLLRDYLVKLGKKVICIREPGTTKLGESIRKILINNDMNEISELFLFMAARNQIVHEQILPNLTDIIICDRFIDSSVAYQSYGRGIDLDFINQLNAMATNNLEPDLTFFLDITPNISLKRLKTDERDRFEDEDLAFHERVYFGYKQLAEQKKRIVTINANDSVQNIHTEILKTLTEF